MKRSIQAVVDGILLLAILVPAVQLVLNPSRRELHHADGVPEALEISAAEAPFEEELEPAVQPEQIARLFGWRKKVAVKDDERAAVETVDEVVRLQEPEVLSYLLYVGYAVDSPGDKMYFVKNTRTGQMLSIHARGARNGWVLIDESESGILVERDDIRYRIPFERNR